MLNLQRVAHPFLRFVNRLFRPVRLGQESMRALARAGGRITRDSQTHWGTLRRGAVAARPDPAASWRTLHLQRSQLLALSSSRLAQIAQDLSPQINKGIWDFLLFANPGYVLTADTSRGEAALVDFEHRLEEQHGYIGSMIDACYNSILFGGAFFLELVLDEFGRMPVDLVVLDPMTAMFRRFEDEVRGQYWQLGQRDIAGQFQAIDTPFVIYAPVKKFADEPYGRPVVTSAIYAAVFLLGLIQDLRRVVANQGFSRQDYEVNLSEILTLLSYVDPGTVDSDTKVAEFIDEHLSQIRKELSRMDIDSDYVHTSTVQVNYATGGVVASNLAGVDTLVRMLERQVTNGMASIPLLMADNESLAETQASRQVENFVSQVHSMQRRLASMLSRLLTLGLRSQGIRGEAHFSFKKQRILDAQTIAETESTQVESILQQVEVGVLTAADAREQIDNLRDPLFVR